MFVSDMTEVGVQVQPVYMEDGDFAPCWSPANDDVSIRIGVAEGLEAWTLRAAQNAGYIVTFAHSTAGGSGYLRDIVPARFFFSEAVTPSTIDHLRDVALCRVKTRLFDYFDEVEVTRCPDEKFSDAMCWRIWVSGHTSHTTGFRPSVFENKIDDRFWVSEKTEVWLGYFADQTSSAVQIGTVVLGSKYARLPVSMRPGSSDYHYIDDFYPNIDPYDIDDLLNNSLSDILSSGSSECR